MTFAYFDRVKETSTTAGTGALSLGGASSGYVSFQSVYSNSDTFYYCIQDQIGPNWEVGLGTYTSSGNLLTRTSVLVSSNSNSLVNFTSGALFAFVTAPAAAATGTGGPVFATAPALVNPTVSTQATNDSSTKAASTAFANPGALVAIPGYFKTPSGLIFQWGTTGNIASTATATITLPLTFPTTFFAGYLTATGSFTNASGTTGLTILSTSQFSVTCYQSTTVNFYWWAVGN